MPDNKVDNKNDNKEDDIPEVVEQLELHVLSAQFARFSFQKQERHTR